MKKIHRVFALLMAAIMALSLITTAFAEPTIDTSKKASLSIYKYDITKASSDGAWDAESYVSTGLHDDAVVDKLAKYAIQGVEFTYLRVADVTMSNEVVDGQRTVGVLYGFDNSERSNAVLSAIGLTAADAHKTENGINFFTSDMLNNKLAAALAANATTVKNALETAVRNGGIALTETDASGHTSADQLEQGLYLVVETRVPENVTSTCNPFFVSLPMTTIDGAAWNYDVTVYPKNQTGNPTLDKTVREAKNSTGKNTGSLTSRTVTSILRPPLSVTRWTIRSSVRCPPSPPRHPLSASILTSIPCPKVSSIKRTMWSSSSLRMLAVLTRSLHGPRIPANSPWPMMMHRTL